MLGLILAASMCAQGANVVDEIIAAKNKGVQENFFTSLALDGSDEPAVRVWVYGAIKAIYEPNDSTEDRKSVV